MKRKATETQGSGTTYPEGNIIRHNSLSDCYFNCIPLLRKRRSMHIKATLGADAAMLRYSVNICFLKHLKG